MSCDGEPEQLDVCVVPVSLPVSSLDGGHVGTDDLLVLPIFHANRHRCVVGQITIAFPRVRRVLYPLPPLVFEVFIKSSDVVKPEVDTPGPLSRSVAMSVISIKSIGDDNLGTRSTFVDRP